MLNKSNRRTSYYIILFLYPVEAKITEIRMKSLRGRIHIQKFIAPCRILTTTSKFDKEFCEDNDYEGFVFMNNFVCIIKKIYTSLK